MNGDKVGAAALVVTTTEGEESRPLNRVYWLESTGFASGDHDTVIQLIKTTIDPDVWDDMGGPSTMSALGSARPALLISTTYEVHNEIEKLFETLRETHFGVDPVLEAVRVPADPNQGGFGGGLGGGGFGGGFGGQGGGGFF